MKRPTRTLLIAEVGSVHDGSFGNAMNLVAAAAAAGADAVKFQTHIPEAETLPDAPSPSFFASEPRFEYFRRTGFTPDQWRALAAHCAASGVEFMSSPFSEEAVDLLETVGMTRYKIPSGEVTNLPLLARIASLGKPVLLSSGMSSWRELDCAVEVFTRHGVDLTVMQCTSEYPCPPERVGLNAMVEMRARYGVPVGLSDHTLDAYASLAAVTLGASAIERHFAFSRSMYGSDARHSLEPREFEELVRGIRATETMRDAIVDKNDLGRLQDMRDVFQKSLVVIRAVPRGAHFTADAIGIRKPGTGLAPALLHDVLGRRAARDLAAGTLLQASDIAPEIA